MFLIRSQLFRPVAKLFWIAAGVLVVSLSVSLPIAYANDYESCMTACENDGGTYKRCHKRCWV